MAGITPIALTVTGDEKALWLSESNQLSPDKKAWHRYQEIGVIRNGLEAEFRRDMGLASNYKGVKQLLIPSLLEHTVDELMDIADNIRYETHLDVKSLLEVNDCVFA